MKRIIRIKQFDIIWLCGFLLLFRPANYIIGNTINAVLNYVVVGLSILMTLSCIALTKQGYRIRRPIMMIILLYFWNLVGSSLVNIYYDNPVDFSDVIVYFCTGLFYILLCDIGLWYSPRLLIKDFLIVGIIMCSINAFTMLIYGHSGGMYNDLKYLSDLIGRKISGDYYFLGRDNATYFLCWPVLVMTWLYYYKYNARRCMRIIAIAYTVLLVLSYYYVWSAMAMFACASVPAVLFGMIKSLEYEKKNNRTNTRAINLVKLKTLWPVALVFSVLLSTGSIIVYFSPIIQNVFHKKITLTDRTLIWGRAYSEIARSPIIGFGCEPTNVSISKLLINHTHNMFLETLYRGGIIGLLLFILTFTFISRDSDKAIHSSIQRFLVITVFVFMICSSVYFAYYRYHYLILLISLCHIEMFDSIGERRL